MSEDIAERLRCLPVDCDGTCHACAAADEIERLRRWKTNATYVLDAWQEAWELAGCPSNLGATKSEAMLDEITRLRAEVEHEREQSDEWTKTLDAIDELHRGEYDTNPDSFTIGEVFCITDDEVWPCRTHLLIHPQEEQ